MKVNIKIPVFWDVLPSSLADRKLMSPPSVQNGGSRFFQNVGTFQTASVVLWSEFLATDPETRVRFPTLPEKTVMGLERGPLSLVSTTEELLDRKVAAPV
jgi:hypothetical protein